MAEITSSISDPDLAAQPRRQEPAARASMRRLLIETARINGLPDDAILARGSQSRPIARARRMAWWAARRVFPRLSYARIGQLTGGYDTATVNYGVGVCERDRRRDPVLRDLTHALFIALTQSGDRT